jgi:predicted nucleic acid-binding protein
MILVDTAPLVALCDPRDGKHATALRQVESLATVGLVLGEAVLTESCFHLPHRSQRSRLRALLDGLHVQTVAVTGDRGFWDEAFQWLDKYSEHEPDWADACLAVLSGRDQGYKIWTYDREFKTTWRRPNGTAIPLAVK